MYATLRPKLQGLSANRQLSANSAGAFGRGDVTCRFVSSVTSSNDGRTILAKGQQKSNREKKKPKQDKKKVPATNAPVFPTGTKDRQTPPKGGNR
jgi:hypothetical protein